MKTNTGWVAVSGGFDPIHIGHVRMFKEARKLGKKLVVILNNDNWLRTKKGFVFMSQNERKEILLETGLVDKVTITDHEKNDSDVSVNRELTILKPEIFANGGDRKPDGDPIPEVELCKKLGIKMVYNIGKGGKVQSSSSLTEKNRLQGIMTKKPWGRMTLYAEGENYWMKTLTVKPGEALSLQSHKGRVEFWLCTEGVMTVEVDSVVTELTKGETISFGKGAVHRASSKKGATVIEIGYGTCDEKDIERFEDKYGRVE